MIDQGRILQESRHWVSLMRYALEAWRITRELPEWENQGPHNVTRKCFKSLSQFCAEAIRRGNFETSALEIYIERYVKYRAVFNFSLFFLIPCTTRLQTI